VEGNRTASGLNSGGSDLAVSNGCSQPAADIDFVSHDGISSRSSDSTAEGSGAQFASAARHHIFHGRPAEVVFGSRPRTAASSFGAGSPRAAAAHEVRMDLSCAQSYMRKAHEINYVWHCHVLINFAPAALNVAVC